MTHNITDSLREEIDKSNTIRSETLKQIFDLKHNVKTLIQESVDLAARQQAYQILIEFKLCVALKKEKNLELYLSQLLTLNFSDTASKELTRLRELFAEDPGGHLADDFIIPSLNLIFEELFFDTDTDRINLLISAIQ